MNHLDPDVRTRELAAESLQHGSPTAWFDQLYSEAGRGEAVVPWDRGEEHPLLVQWCAKHPVDGPDRAAIVVGCGPGHDVEFLAGLGYATTAFDVSPTAIEQAKRRYPMTSVDYRAADLLDLPREWFGRFDLVVEIMTVQSMPREVRTAAIRTIAALVAPAGTLVVVGATPDAEPDTGPPWPLTHAEVGSFADGQLETIAIEELPRPDNPSITRWLAEFRAAPARS